MVVTLSLRRQSYAFSLSKIFTSTAVGMAVEEGHIAIDDTVATIFQKISDDPNYNLKAMRVRDLLTMTTGHQEEPQSIQKKCLFAPFSRQRSSINQEHILNTIPPRLLFNRHSFRKSRVRRFSIT